MKKNNQSLSIIFPAYNEEKNIEGAIVDAFNFAQKKFRDFEVIVVNDGSSDKTREIVKRLAKRKKRLKLINNSKNLGYGATVWRGLKSARKELIFFSDGDRQFDLKEISKVLNKITEYDVVIGYRKNRRDPIIRKINAWGWRLLIRVTLNLRIKDIDCAFKLFKKEVIDSLEIKSTGATFSAELIYQIKKHGLKLDEMPVSHYPRLQGKPTGAKFHVVKKAFSELWNLFKKETSLVNAKSKYVYWAGAVILFLSRILLRSNSLDFFDSSEYMWRTNDGSLLKSMATGHAPFHPLYVFFSWLLHHSPYKFSEIVSLDITSAVLGTVSIIFLFLFVRKLFSSRIAWLSSVIFALLPFVWISQTTILVDATEHAFYFISLYLWLLALSNQNLKGRVLALSAGLSFGLAAFAHTQVAIWILGFLALPLVIERINLRDLFYKFILFFIGGAVFILAYIKLLLFANSIGWHDATNSFALALKYLIFGNIGDRDPVEIKKALYYLAALGSSMVVLSAVFGAVKLFFAEKRKFFFLAIWFLPFLIGSTYIYENLYGRTLIIGLAPVAILASYFILNLKRFRWLVLIITTTQLLILGVPVIYKYHFLPSPIEHIKSTLSSLPKGGIFISSNLTKTLANSAYEGEYVNFGDVGNGAGYVEEKVKNALDKGLPAFILSDALILPYHRYDGEYYDLRSTGIGSSSEHTTMLDSLIRNYSLSLVKIDDYKFQRALYQINSSHNLKDDLQKIDANLGQSPVIFGRIKSDNAPVSGLIVNDKSSLICSAPKEDITRLDAGFCLIRGFSKNDRIENWTYSDKDGWFFLPVPSKKSQIILSANAVQTRSKKIKNAFALEGDIINQYQLKGEFNKLSDLETALLSEEQSYYVVSSRSNNQSEYLLYSFDFNLSASNILKARDLSGEASGIVRDGVAGKVRAANGNAGYVISGPYLDLDPGKYKLTFSVRSKIKKDNNIIFDVSGNFARDTLAEEEISQIDLYSNNYKDISLEFNLEKEEKGVEFRIKVPDGASLLVDSLTFSKM